MKGNFKLPKSLSYNGDAKNWLKFKQQFEIYMKLTGLEHSDEETKVNVFLNIAGEEAIEIFNSLELTPEEKKNYDQVLEGFENYCASKQNVIYKSFKFFTRVQEPGESFNNYYNDLQLMASYCNFGEQRDRLVRDRIIAGIRNERLQEEFLKAPDLELEEVLARCIEDDTERMRMGIFKCEVENNCDNLLDDEESNNNFDGLITHDINGADDYMFGEVDVPEEIILNEIPRENTSSHLIEEECTEERIEEVEQSDVKPVNIVKPPLRTYKRNTKDGKKGKILEKRKKAESIQKKIEEIKNKLSKDIKTEEDCEQAGTRQRYTRSRTRNVVVKNEPIETSVEEEDELPTVQEDENDLPPVQEDEDEQPPFEEEAEDDDMTVEEILIEFEDPRMLKDSFDYQEDVEDDSINGDSSEVLDNFEDSTGVTESNGKIELTYTQTKESTSSKPAKNSKTKGAKSKKKPKKETVNIVKVKRGNLPPLILKTVKKKTILLGKMPYPCKKCDSSFWTNGQLERHQLVHVLKKVTPPARTPKKIFKCEECGKEFKKICDLERHTRVHTGEKPSVCNICNKRFQQAYNLNKHLLIHTQEKNFECVICQKRFGRNDVLNRHVLTHSIDKPFHCSICSKTFIRNTQLNLHLRKHHGLDPKATGKKTSLTPAASKSSD